MSGVSCCIDMGQAFAGLYGLALVPDFSTSIPFVVLAGQGCGPGSSPETELDHCSGVTLSG